MRSTKGSDREAYLAIAAVAAVIFAAGVLAGALVF